MVRLLRFSGLLLALPLLVGLLVQGCSHSSSGHPAGPGDIANFEVTNRHNELIHLYVDGGSIGDVDAGRTEDFVVKAGFRSLEIRESGSSRREWQGDYDFTSSLLTFTYDPRVNENLRVTNNDNDDVEIFVDLVYVGTVRSNATRDFLIVSGRYDLHAREDGTTILDYVGTFNFNTSELVVLTHN